MPRRVASALLLLVGCFDPEPGFYSCADPDACPDGWFCHSDARCYPDPEADMGPVPRDMPAVEDDACVDPPQRPVDLLLVVDDSPSMLEEQARLQDGVRGLLEALTLGRDASGSVDAYAPVEDLHVGVITPNLGASSVPIPGTMNCEPPGDDGVLLNETRNGDASCPETFGSRFLTYDPSVGINALADDLGCLASVGVQGCGFEQQLEAMARALVPSTTAAIEGGQADGPNEGFLRESSVLVVSVVTDESDCSARDLELFDPESDTYGDFSTNANTRCGEHAETALHSIGRYVDALLTHVRGTRNTDVIFAPLVGVPPELVGEDWDIVLRHPSQQFTIDPSTGITFTPACESPGTSAQPSPRFLELAEALEEQGGRAVLGSICDTDYGSYFDTILAELEPFLVTETCD